MDIQDLKEFDILIARARGYILNDLFYSIGSLKNFTVGWKVIKKFMIDNCVKNFSKEVADKILLARLGNKKFQEFSEKDFILYKGITLLSQFKETGEMKNLTRRVKKEFPFNGLVGNLASEFIKFKELNNCSASRIRAYNQKLSIFSEYCSELKVKSIEEVNLLFIINFLKHIDSGTGSNINTTLSTLRGFTKYLFEENKLDNDISIKIPKFNSITQARLPSNYTEEEIEKLVLSIEQSSPIGKRNYAIILIGVKTALRASDIANLKFENIHLDRSTIEIYQVKTGKMLVLPLFPDVGNAILNYLQHGRVKSDDSFLFLNARAPYLPLRAPAIGHIANRAFLKSGIQTQGRSIGSHTLRHSLAARLFENRAVIQVIANVLGDNPETVNKYYIRIDLKSMRQGALDVNDIPSSFYENISMLQI